MATVGEQLRRAREARNLTVEQVAEITKIRTDHVRALEEGNYDVFSAPVYIKGFVRTYSTLLKEDVPATMAALEAELGQTHRFAEAPALAAPFMFALTRVITQRVRVLTKRYEDSIHFSRTAGAAGA